jgi:hypothetical protein
MKMRNQIMEIDRLSQLASGNARVGRVVKLTASGEVLVDYAGNRIGPIRARVAVNDCFEEPDQAVLLVFEDGDPTLPIIAGVIKDRVGDAQPARTPLKDKLVLESKSELTLVCGQSSITLRKDGRVMVKGAELMSRASGTNKIRGASVKIN